MTNWILGLLGLHTCRQCARYHLLNTVSWPAQQGIVYGTRPVDVTALTCDGKIVDPSTVKRCRSFKK
jgi:hypothetical protein